MRKPIRRNLILGLLVAATALTGCQRQAEVDPEPSAEAAQAATKAALSAAPKAKSSASPETARAPGKGPLLELLAPGAEPRRPLRYVFQKGQSDQLAMKQKIALSMRIGSESMPKTPAPETTITMKLEITEIENGIATLNFSVTDAKLAADPGLPPGAGAGVSQLLEDLKTYTGTQRVNSRGVLTSFAQDTSGIKNPQVSQMMNSMEQTMNQMMAPMPEEPVGVGAKWRTITRADQFGLKLQQTATIEVVRIDDQGVDLDIVLGQSAPPGRISAPGLPAGVVVDLVSMDSTGKAKTRIEFDHLVPRSEIQMSVKMKMKIPETPGLGARGDQIMDTTMDMDLDIAPK